MAKVNTAKNGQINVSDYSSEVAVNGLQSDTQYTFVIEETIKLGINGQLRLVQLLKNKIVRGFLDKGFEW